MECENCFNGKLIWKRKSKNVLGWNLRFYSCNNCGLETKKEEFPESIKIVTIYPNP